MGYPTSLPSRAACRRHLKKSACRNNKRRAVHRTLTVFPHCRHLVNSISGYNIANVLCARQLLFNQNFGVEVVSASTSSPLSFNKLTSASLSLKYFYFGHRKLGSLLSFYNLTLVSLSFSNLTLVSASLNFHVVQ